MPFLCKCQALLAVARLRLRARRKVASAVVLVQKEVKDDGDKEDPKPGHTPGTPQRQRVQSPSVRV
jgi:hypothetical protein